MAATKHKLVIVESPAKARTIAKFLGRGYKVEACNGHVRDLPKSQIGVGPENDFEPKYITIRGRGDVLDRLRKEAKGASQILLATDPDREGEAISWHLAYILKIDPDSPCRVEFHEITSKAVKEAIKHPRAVRMPLVNAQQARRVLDRLVGYKISPLLWVKVKKGLSAGRVQSVATRMIVDREDEIDAFIPEEYWDVTTKLTANGKHFAARLYRPEIHGEAEAKAAVERIRSGGLTVTSDKRAERKKNPSPPFTTPNLQQEASRKLRFTTSKTMQIAQQLYEGVDVEGEGTVGLITYIRTDSVRLSDEAIAAAREYIPAQYGPAYLPETPNVYKGRTRAQDAHEAIRPTDVTRRPENVKASLTRDQYNLYRLIYLRFLASQMTPALYDTETAEITGEDGVVLRFYGEHKKFAGFTSVYEEGTDEEVVSTETTLPLLSAGDSASLDDATAEQHFTQPPARYTEASLVRALEEKGIGRPSTYAPTISTIIARGYVTREQRRLYPTLLGRMVTQMMCENFSDIVDMQFTADMENKLDRIEEENIPWKDVIREFYGPFEKTLEKAEQGIEKVKIEDEVSDEKCELCGAPMVYKMGRYGKFLACSRFPDCRGTKAILTEIGVPCPECGAPILEKTSRKGRKFYGCKNYPECTFVSWDKPVAEKCPVCGSYMTLKESRKNGRWYLCSNESCRHREKAPEEETQENTEE
ncbi:MAG: type I DNA topoisomerase [Clostridiales bacterium]|nr:type I DNA topoisomerase [Clostridiales bacterium]MDY2835381.1 type I DNA topoisomerase [Candidatus Aphodomonas sp.]